MVTNKSEKKVILGAAIRDVQRSAFLETRYVADHVVYISQRPLLRNSTYAKRNTFSRVRTLLFHGPSEQRFIDQPVAHWNKLGRQPAGGGNWDDITRLLIWTRF